MAGYWNRPDETAKVMTEDGYFKSGDMGFMDEKGYIKIVDRKKDMILVSGFNVFPNELEDVIARHPGVLEVAAIGVPDEHSGEVPKLFVVKKDPKLTAEELLAYCKAESHRLQAPEIHRVPHRTAEDQCRQDPAAGAARLSVCRITPVTTRSVEMPGEPALACLDSLAEGRAAGRRRIFVERHAELGTAELYSDISWQWPRPSRANSASLADQLR